MELEEEYTINDSISTVILSNPRPGTSVQLALDGNSANVEVKLTPNAPWTAVDDSPYSADTVLVTDGVLREMRVTAVGGTISVYVRNNFTGAFYG